MDANEPLNPEFTQDGERRIRTKVACDYCRKRKSKCNGEQPCSKCITRRRECAYTYVPKERKKRERKSTTNGAIKKKQGTESNANIQQLTSRIGSLESLLGKLITRLGPSEQVAFANELNEVAARDHSEKDKGSGDSSGMDDDDDDDDDGEDSERDHEREEDSGDEYEVALNDGKAVVDPKQLKDMMAPAEKGCVTTANIKRRLLQYFGSHALFYSISAKSIEWLKSRMLNSSSSNMNDVFAPLKQVPLALNDAVQKSSSLLNKEGPILIDKKLHFSTDEKMLIFEVLDKYYNNQAMAPFICEVSLVRELFQKYFLGITRKDETIINALTYSELLIMNISVVLCLVSIPEGDEIESLMYPNLASKSIIYLQNDLLTRLFENAMECYDRVSRVCDGVRSVIGLALLTLYVDVAYVTDFHINYTIASIMIRYAKDIGLHRVDALARDNEVDACMKRKLWWFCECMGVDIAYKSGKPMLVNMEDVTTLTELDDHSFMSIPTTLFFDNSYMKNATEIATNSRIHGAHYYFAYFNLMLARIKAKAYRKIYSRLPSNINVQGLLTFVNEINDDLKIMNKLMLPETAPLRKSDTVTDDLTNAFVVNPSILNYWVLNIKVSYFAHLLAINRVPFVKNFEIEDERLVMYGNYSLTGARRMLEAIKGIQTLQIPERLYSTILFYPMAAFCSLLGNCLVFPKQENTMDDAVLICEATIAFFSLKGMSERMDSKRAMYDLLSRLLLRVLIDSMEKQSGVNLYEKVPGLEHHIASLFTLFPEVFVNGEDKTISLIPENPSSNGSTPTNGHKSAGSDGSHFSGTSSATMVDRSINGDQKTPMTVTPGLNFNNENMMLMNGNYDLFHNVNFDAIMTDDALTSVFFSELNDFPGVFDGSVNGGSISNGPREQQGI
ncbi:hypothetical protein Cantr_00929 [Candida viswanathii]|uniref:Zn(2)-C6 fungal-type domain-containing protein n=1 Tax=Candida viswanathii TaxID=5486 RepID=A0A367YH47_9ASCO|nr:hypothetical protein Cantr_00929 [Candida viswanathii]